MTNRFARELSYGKKILLTSAAVLAIVGPVAVQEQRVKGSENGRNGCNLIAARTPS